MTTTTKDRTNVKTLAQEALDQSSGISADAVNLLYNRVTTDPVLMREFLPGMVRAWCQLQVGTCTGQTRLRSWTPQPPQHKANRLNAAIRLSLLSFPLPGGKQLGSASADEVRQGAAHYQGKAEDAAWKARWLDKIATTMGNAHSVEDVFSEYDLERLQAETE